MSHTTAAARSRILPAVSFPFAVPTVLGANAVVLLALDQLHAIPSWVKLAATIFLSF
ncbi:MAG: hypothetical protein ABI718_09600 [Acidobacteriota bacterium]